MNQFQSVAHAAFVYTAFCMLGPLLHAVVTKVHQ